MTPQFFNQFFSTPLAIAERSALALKLSMTELCRGDTRVPNGQVKDDNKPEWEPTHDWLGNPIQRATKDNDGTAIIPLKGVISKGLGPLGEFLGFMDVSRLIRDIVQAIEDPEVKKIALDIASPGGTVVGTRDAAELVVKARESGKPVMAYSGDVMASASYYIPAGATAVYSGSSAIVGSIGVFTWFVDDEGFWENMGVQWLVFRSGILKGAGIDVLSDEQKALIQEEIDELGNEFRSWVTSFRDIAPGLMEGQTYSGKQAASLGFVDGNANTFEEALRDFKNLTKI